MSSNEERYLSPGELSRIFHLTEYAVKQTINLNGESIRTKQLPNGWVRYNESDFAAQISDESPVGESPSALASSRQPVWEVCRNGNVINTWGVRPEETQIQNNYAPGTYQIIERDENGLVKSIATVTVAGQVAQSSESPATADPIDAAFRIMETAQKMSKIGGGNGDSLAIIEIMKSQNAGLMNLVTALLTKGTPDKKDDLSQRILDRAVDMLLKNVGGGYIGEEERSIWEQLGAGFSGAIPQIIERLNLGAPAGAQTMIPVRTGPPLVFPGAPPPPNVIQGAPAGATETPTAPPIAAARIVEEP